MSGSSRACRRQAPVVVSLSTFFVCAAGAQAGALTLADWIGPDSGSWQTSGNWNPATVPTNGVNLFHAVVNNGGGIQANINGTVTVSKLR